MNVEDKIREAITFSKQNGVIISKNIWGVEYNYVKKKWQPKKEKMCCVLGAVILKYTKGWISDYITFEKEVSNILGVDEDWIDNFIRSFDEYENIDINHEAYKIATKLKVEFNI